MKHYVLCLSSPYMEEGVIDYYEGKPSLAQLRKRYELELLPSYLLEELLKSGKATYAGGFSYCLKEIKFTKGEG